ncbi:MAG: sialidase family protein [Xanthomonadales bacterium]|nr:sialidase family protein [Xanthomonadales bacterium]
MPPAKAADLVEIPLPAGAGSSLPHLSSAAGGTTLLSWVERSDAGHALRVSTLAEDTWSAPVTVADGQDWFVNWADFPSVVPLTDQSWVAHWLVRSTDAPYAYDVKFSASTDGGRTWSRPASPHHDGTPTEHGFATIFPLDAGFGMVWLDGRATGESSSAHDHASGGAMTLRYAEFDGAGIRQERRLVDDRVCDCCQTDVAVSGKVPMVFYRDRSAGEIRDVSVSRLGENGWSTPTPVYRDGWKIAGCPVNGPAAASLQHRVAVAWYTASDDRPRVQLGLSDDGGASFSRPVLIDGNRPLGRVDVDFLPGGDALVSWLAEDRQGQSALTLRRVSPGGVAGPAVAVASTSATRPSGFPQLLVTGGRVILAWTDLAEGKHRVRSATLAAMPPPG